MTYTIWAGYTNGAGNAFTMAAGDGLQTLAGSVLASSAGNGVNAAGSVSIEVGGTVGGYSNGIFDATAATDSSTVYIEKTGNVFSGPGWQSVYITGSGYHTIVNAGSVQSLGSGGWGIATLGAGTIVNQASGTISAGSGVRDMDGTPTDVTSFVNYGTVTGALYAYAGTGADQETIDNAGTMLGRVLMGTNTSNFLYNVGTMDATGANGTGFSMADSVLNNAGTMYESLATSSPINMITFGDHAGDYFVNSGVVAEMHAAALSNAIAFGNGAGDVLNNNAGGAIYGNIAMGTGAGDDVINSGLIVGNVTLGSGAGDLYYGTQGKLSGTVICGSGGDLVYTGSDSEYVTGGLGNDYFVAGTGGSLILREGVANQAANGWDTVVNFQAYNAASGTGTFLHLDPAMASTTTFTAFQGGTLVQMSLGGGNSAYVNVTGASVAEVKAQTYFS
ncbi:hypothetical protein [Rhodoblastus sp.]|uniref:hypothetical protein n=1 Tax=Rhodoblastus sp. TaxID=1962975 RepID=UPI00261D8603|nr:hypothetical protein [Rhodoblastus sp.]